MKFNLESFDYAIYGIWQNVEPAFGLHKEIAKQLKLLR